MKLSVSWWRRFFHFTQDSQQVVVATTPRRIYLPTEVATATAHLLSSFCTASAQHEGIAYWAGVPTDTAWVVTTVIVPTAYTTPGSYQTTAVANAQVISKINHYHLQIVAQVHGHPGKWVEHSEGDGQGAFMPYTGFYSIVVPYYGNKGLLPLTSCGIHLFQGTHFLQLSSEEIKQQFVLVPECIDLRRQDHECYK